MVLLARSEGQHNTLVQVFATPNPGAGHLSNKICSVHQVAVHFLGSLLLVLGENNAMNHRILVVSGYFFKWTEAFLLPDKKAKTVACCFVKEIVTLIKDVISRGRS